MANAIYNWVQRVWYGGARSGMLLLPLSGLYWLLIRTRAALYRAGFFRVRQSGAPVVVIGNITAGGTGKSPTAIWLVEQLRSRGYRPGIISRGYGGSRAGTSMRVDADSDAAIVGDEPVMLARRTGGPVTVDSNRLRAAGMLIDDGVDVIVADDGLQHIRLGREFEICVVDGERLLGNGYLLPAGPLREPASRLQSVDAVLVNGGEFAGGIRFDLVADSARRLNGSLTKGLEEFRETTVHAIAAIGNPQRFFELLRGFGIQVIEHRFPDHAALKDADLAFDDGFNVFMTEKDAVKLGSRINDRYWFVPVELQMADDDATRLVDDIENRLKIGVTADPGAS